MSVFVYRVPGPVPTRVREMLDYRYGPGNWRSKWEDDYAAYLVLRRYSFRSPATFCPPIIGKLP